MRLLVILTALSLIALGQTGKNHNQPTQTHDKSAQKTSAKSVPSPVAQQVPIPDRESEVQRQQDATKQEPKPWLTHGEWVMAIITGIYVVLTGLYVISSYRTLAAVQRQADLIERQANLIEQQGTLTEQSVGIAKKSVEAIANIERPWIVVTLINNVKDRFRNKPDGTSEGVLYFEWLLTNHGKTAAIVFEIVAILEVKTFEEVEELRKTSPEGKPTLRPDAFIVGPGQSHECPGITMVNYWTVEERTAVLRRNALLVAHGLVKYRNTVDTERVHQTPFIGIYIWGERFFEDGTFRRFYDASGYNQYT